MTTAAAWRIRCPAGYLDPEKQRIVHSIVTHKVGLDDLVGSWDMVGPDAICTYKIRARPPRNVTLADIAAAVDSCEEWELVAGLGPRRKPVIISLADDSPHICSSAASGAGKTILAMTFAVQVLRRGGRVILMDTKGAHRWARGLSGVTYHRTIANIHHALIGLDSLAQARNDQAAEEAESWDPGERIFCVLEEWRSTITSLRDYWEENKARLWKGEGKPPKVSPAVTAYRHLADKGRSAKVNLFLVAQMFTAVLGGTEARENFSVRCLARYTTNNWKMLAPEVAMPRKSDIRGRWQVVFGGVAHEVQVPFDALPDGRTLDQEAVKAFANPTTVRPSVDARTEPPHVGSGVSSCSVHRVLPGAEHRTEQKPNTVGPVRYTLAEAARADWCPLSYDALRIARSRSDNWPKPHMRGSRETWTEDELRSALNGRISQPQSRDGVKA